MAWRSGRGLLGPLAPLIGDWSTGGGAGDSAAAAMRCSRHFAKLGKGWISLDARWITGPDKEYRETALFGAGDDGTLACFSFTSDGKRSVGRLCDASDVHAQAIGFIAKMPAGTARMVYWPLDDGSEGFYFAVESQTKKGWNRFLTQHYRPRG